MQLVIGWVEEGTISGQLSGLRILFHGGSCIVQPGTPFHPLVALPSSTSLCTLYLVCPAIQCLVFPALFEDAGCCEIVGREN